MAAEHNISTFEQLCNIATLTNVDNLSIDLAQWLVIYVATMEDFRRKHPKETEGLSNWEIAKCHFIWIDDGKNDIKGIQVSTEQ